MSRQRVVASFSILQGIHKSGYSIRWREREDNPPPTFN